MLKRVLDVLAALLVMLGAPLFRKVGNWPGGFPVYRRMIGRAQVQWRSTQFYHPTYRDVDLPRDVTSPRDLPGADINEEAQRALLAAFDEQTVLDAGLAIQERVGFDAKPERWR